MTTLSTPEDGHQVSTEIKMSWLRIAVADFPCPGNALDEKRSDKKGRITGLEE
jgi:hypothetical protein